MNRDRGMTLIELLAALAILAAVSVAASSWTVAAARTSASVSRRLTWERAANAALDAIFSDLNTGDISANASGVEATDDRLVIRTRDTGPVEHEYAIDAGRLVRRSFTTGLSGRRVRPGERPARVLVGGVVSWSATIEEDEEDGARTLLVTLIGPGGLQLARSESLP